MADNPAAYWNDEAGTRWVRHQESLDRFMGPITERLLVTSKVAEGERVIDVGCGCGDTSVQFASKVGPTGSVLGVDISEPMLGRAMERTKDMPHVEMLRADATSHPFPPSAADLLTSRFGVMFFPDPAKSFRNLRSGLRSGGRLCMAVWQIQKKNTWMAGPLAALPELPPPEPSDVGLPGPFSLADAADAGALLTRAGFVDIRLESFETTVSVGESPSDALRFYNQVGPLSRHLDSLEGEARASAETRVLRYIEENWQTDALPRDASCWFLHAVAP